MQRRKRGARRERGSALFVAIVLTVIGIGLSYSTIMISVSEIKKAKVTEATTRAHFAAEAGVELGMNEIAKITKDVPLGQAFGTLDSLFKNGGAAAVTRAFVDHELVHNSKSYGTVNVQFSEAARGAAHRDIVVTVDAYVPSRYRQVGAQMVEDYDAHARVERTVRVGLESGSVFDYGYFINNWGWFYASSITANGNVRSNGQFDAGGYRPTINGIPRYRDINIQENGGSVNVDLLGYIDDNNDGVTNGSDGGIYSSWDIAGANSVRGMASNAKNRHDFVDPVPMPNLSDLDLYEDVAKSRTVGSASAPSSASVGTFVTGPVWGDEPGESGNLYLRGTDANPIRLDGPVVVRGDLIIYGKVTGQGAFYVGGNIYVPNNLEYVNGLTALPANNSEASTEQWIAQNHEKDFLGLFAKESIVIGDYTNSSFRSNVGNWLSHSLNQSKEDAGEDKVPNTRNGRDGVRNTPDDDVLEGDNVWTVDRYTQDDANAGLIPQGKNVGDAIAGSGEDIDGDGVFDPTIGLADFDLSATLSPANWGGLTSSVSRYRDIANTRIGRIDGILYTNHALAFRTSNPVVFNGAMISRNEAIVYGGSFTINYDRRLLGGGNNPNVILPKVFAPLQDVSSEYQRVGSTTSTAVPVVPNTFDRASAATGRVMTRVKLP